MGGPAFDIDRVARALEAFLSDVNDRKLARSVAIARGARSLERIFEDSVGFGFGRDYDYEQLCAEMVALGGKRGAASIIARRHAGGDPNAFERIARHLRRLRKKTDNVRLRPGSLS